VAAVALLTGCGAPAGGDHHGTAADALGAQVTPSAPAGTASASPDLAVRDGERLVELALPAAAYEPSVSLGSTDDYRCFLLDPALSGDAFVTGTDVRPDNEALVHHAILFRVPPTQVAAAQARDAADPGLGWTCYGGTGLESLGDAPLADAPWLAAWAPGGRPTAFRDGLGVPVEAGSRVVLQVHYNLLAGSGGDRSSVVLRLAPGDAALEPLRTMLLVAPVELPCAPGESGPLCDRTASVLDTMRRFGDRAGATVAGLQLLCGGDVVDPASGDTQACDRTLREDVRVQAVGGHMHLLGRSITIDALPAGGEPRTLLDIPVWDFDDQRARPLQRSVDLHAGDVLRVTCTHDARLRGQLPALAEVPPRYVTWGEGTSDEMCLGIVAVTAP
jgi:hypothetical protein